MLKNLIKNLNYDSKFKPLRWKNFIEPTQNIRSLGVKLKLNPTKTFVKNKTIILIDDSLVRGTTCYKIVRMLYESGAKKCMSGLHAQK